MNGPKNEIELLSKNLFVVSDNSELSLHYQFHPYYGDWWNAEKAEKAENAENAENADFK